MADQVRTILTGGMALAVAIFSTTPAAAQSQSDPFDQRLDDFNSTLYLAERAYNAGLCTTRDDALARAEQQVRQLMALNPRYTDWTHYSRLIAERRAQPCPPPGEQPPPPRDVTRVPAPPSPPSPPRATMRDGISQPPPPSGVTGSDLNAISQTLERADANRVAYAARRRAGEAIARAQDAWRAGDCAGRAAALAEAREALDLGESVGADDVYDRAFQDRRESLRNVESRECPPVTAERQLELYGNFVQIDGPRTGIGFVRDGAGQPELFAGQTRERFNFYGGGGALTFNRGSTPITVGASYGEGSGRTAFAVPAQGANGGAAGATFGAPAQSGSTGLSGGTVALEGTTRVEAQNLAVTVGAEVARIGPGASVTAQLFAEFNRRQYQLNLIGRSASSGAQLFTQERDQEVEDKVAGAMLRVDAAFPLSRSSTGVPGVSFRVGGGVGAYIINSGIDSTERVAATVGPDQNFTIATDESKTRIGLAADAHVEIAVALSGRAELFAGGAFSIRDTVGNAFNPTNGNQVLNGETTGIELGDWTALRAMLGVRFEF